MTKKTICIIAVFILIELLCAALAWLGGFNFDKRHPDVAATAALSIWLGALIAFAVGETSE